MSLLGIIARSLGLAPPLQPREPEPFGLTRAARKRQAQLPDGHVLNVATRPVDGGRVVSVVEGEPMGPLRTVDGVEMAILPEDEQRLAGLRLHWDGKRFGLRLDLQAQAEETPNPDTRLYLVDRLLARGRPCFFTAGDRGSAPPLAARLLGLDGVASVLLRENTVAVERADELGWAVLDRQVEAALREHFLLCGGVLDADALARREDPLEEAILQILEQHVLPRIHRDGGNVELVDVRDGVVRVQLTGACRTCPAAFLTLQHGIERTLKAALPDDVNRVEAVQI